MLASTISASASDQTHPARLDALDEFELDVQVTTEAATGYTSRACDTSDTCGSTCASACVSS